MTQDAKKTELDLLQKKSARTTANFMFMIKLQRKKMCFRI